MREGIATSWWGRIGLKGSRAPVARKDGPPVVVVPHSATNGHGPDALATEAPERPKKTSSVGRDVPGWDDGVLDKICRAYQFGSPADWDSLPGVGRETRVVLTEDGREFAVHAVNASSRGTLALKAELDLREYLWHRHYPVAELALTSSGARYLSLGGHHYFATVLENAQPYDPTDKTHCVEAATGLAQFHDAAREFSGTSPLGTSPYLTEIVQQRVEWMDACLKANDVAWGRTNHLQQALASARHELQYLLPGIATAYASEQCRLVHGAYDRQAVTFDGLGLAEVTNLENMGFDLRLSDLARSLQSFCTVQDGDDVSCIDMDPAVLSRFLAAYEHLSPLTPLEAEALPLFLRAIHLAKVVDDCHRLIEEAVIDDEDSARNRDARAMALALQIGFAPHPSRPDDSS